MTDIDKAILGGWALGFITAIALSKLWGWMKEPRL
jgi:hypothetical protein